MPMIKLGKTKTNKKKQKNKKQKNFTYVRKNINKEHNAFFPSHLEINT